MLVPRSGGKDSRRLLLIRADLSCFPRLQFTKERTTALFLCKIGALGNKILDPGALFDVLIELVNEPLFFEILMFVMIHIGWESSYCCTKFTSD